MKKAVAYLEPYLQAEKEANALAGIVGNGRTNAGKVLMATVKGDVHDIGKNIVGVVLACNNYEIIDLGVMVSCDKILAEAKAQNVDVIGLSGLITPSLDEMVHVAKEMERLGFKIPLMIGGATTSKVHTAVKVAPHYSGAVVHVNDASRSVPVAGSLISEELRTDFMAGVLKDYDRVREQNKNAQSQNKFISIEEARANKFPVDWNATEIATPAFIGNKTFNNYSLAEIAEYIDWTPFFISWEMKGAYPKILKDPVRGEEARKLFADAQAMLKKIIDEKWLTANAVIGIYPANAVGDDVHLSPTLSTGEGDFVFHTLRQQTKKPAGQYNVALADFVKPLSSSPLRGEDFKSSELNTTNKIDWHSNIDNAKEHRSNATEAEHVIWSFVRAKQTGFKFRRQHLIDKYIVDFVCLEKKLVVEIDGKYHEQTIDQDELRTSVLESLGFKVIRFTNEEVIAHPETVISKIKVTCEALTTLSPEGRDGEGCDYIGAFAVTTGVGIDEHVARFEKDHDDYSAIMLKALADRLAEAFAELMHKKVRKEIWGYAKSEDLKNEDLIKEEYAGIRPAPGYPAQPDHTEKITLFKLLDVEKNTGITLTESLAMLPTAAVSGLYFAHPQSHYFGIGKIKKDQVEDYAKRKSATLEEMERWLGSNLAY
jgi:5-methyltetrahydrofolate--homocysteine methyltransferase